MNRACLLLIVLLGAGCSSFPDLSTGVEFEKLEPYAGAASGHRILVAGVSYEPGPREGLSPERGEMRFEAGEFLDELQRALEEVTGEGELPSVALADAPGEAAQEAWRDGYDLIVEARVRRWDATYMGTNGLWFPNALFLAWYFWPIGPHWWIADEVYGVDCELELRVLSTSSERALPMPPDSRLVRLRSRDLDDESDRLGPLDVLEAPRFAFDDLDRGLDLFGTWLTGDLDPDQWDQVSGVLEPYARRHAAIRIAARVADAVTRFEALSEEERAQALAATHGLVIGVSAYEEPCLGADEDAESFASLLAGELEILGPSGQPAEETGDASRVLFAPRKNVKTLLNGQASVEGILEGLEAIGERSSTQDTLVVFFAGRGVRIEGREGLEAYGILPAGSAAPVSLATLAERLRAIPARRRLVVFDADFQQGQRGRGEGPATGEFEAQVRAAFLGGVRQGAVVLASSLGDDEEVQAYEERGLLTHYLVRALQGAADEGSDGLSYADLGAYLTKHVVNLSEVALPKPQRPRVLAVQPLDMIR